MAYTFTPTGSLTLGGYTEPCISRVFNLDFSIGDIVFVAAKARKGVLERVCIKKILDYGLLYGGPVYKDTFNEVWEEDELVSHADAINLAVAFEQSQIAKIDNEITDITTD